MSSPLQHLAMVSSDEEGLAINVPRRRTPLRGGVDAESLDVAQEDTQTSASVGWGLVPKTVGFVALAACAGLLLMAPQSTVMDAQESPSTISLHHEPTCTAKQVMTLTAGQTRDVGTVTIRNDKRWLYVTYETHEGYKLTSTHLNVNSEADNKIITKVDGKRWALTGKNGRPTPGKYGTVPGESLQMSWASSDNVQSYTYQVELTDVDTSNGASLFVLPHAVVEGGGRKDTAYGGDCVNLKTSVADYGAWFCYGNYHLCDVKVPVPDPFDPCADNDCGPASIGASCVPADPYMVVNADGITHTFLYTCQCAQGYGDNVNYDPHAVYPAGHALEGQPNEAGRVRCQNLDYCNDGYTFDSLITAPSFGNRRLLQEGGIGKCGGVGLCVDCAPPSLFHACICPEGYFDDYGTCKNIDMCAATSVSYPGGTTSLKFPLLDIGDSMPEGHPWYGAAYPHQAPPLTVVEGQTCGQGVCVDYDPADSTSLDTWNLGWTCSCESGYTDVQGTCVENQCNKASNVAKCGGSPAFPRGTCTDILAPTQYTCDCTGPAHVLSGSPAGGDASCVCNTAGNYAADENGACVCKDGYFLDGDVCKEKACTAAANQNKCGEPGSYGECVDTIPPTVDAYTCDCTTGYTYTGYTDEVTQVNGECVENQCNKASITAKCGGSPQFPRGTCTDILQPTQYTCDCTGPNHVLSGSPAGGDASCVCAEGYMEAAGGECVEETCHTAETKAKCGESADPPYGTCVQGNHHHVYECDCAEGYTFFNGECVEETCHTAETKAKCGESADPAYGRCVQGNHHLSYECDCAEGYTFFNGECVENACHKQAIKDTCNNDLGSECLQGPTPDAFTCVCIVGYLEYIGECFPEEDFNQCENKGGNAACTGTEGTRGRCVNRRDDVNPLSYFCECSEGYVRSVNADGDESCAQVGGPSGCTPGYWRQTGTQFSAHLCNWVDRSPTEAYVCVFGLVQGGVCNIVNGDGQSVEAACADVLADPELQFKCEGQRFLETLTLDDAIRIGGGGFQALARHSVAALLNGDHVDVNYFLGGVDGAACGTQCVLDTVLARFDQGDSSFVDFVYGNEVGCPIHNCKPAGSETVRISVSFKEGRSSSAEDAHLIQSALKAAFNLDVHPSCRPTDCDFVAEGGEVVLTQGSSLISSALGLYGEDVVVGLWTAPALNAGASAVPSALALTLAALVLARQA